MLWFFCISLFGQSVECIVILDVMMLIWCHCNVLLFMIKHIHSHTEDDKLHRWNGQENSLKYIFIKKIMVLSCSRVAVKFYGIYSVHVWLLVSPVKPGGCLNIKMPSYQFRTPMLKIRWSCDHLILSMGIPIPGKDGLYVESGPWFSSQPFKGPALGVLIPWDNSAVLYRAILLV